MKLRRIFAALAACAIAATSVISASAAVTLGNANGKDGAEGKYEIDIDPTSESIKKIAGIEVSLTMPDNIGESGAGGQIYFQCEKGFNWKNLNWGFKGELEPLNCSDGVTLKFDGNVVTITANFGTPIYADVAEIGAWAKGGVEQDWNEKYELSVNTDSFKFIDVDGKVIDLSGNGDNSSNNNNNNSSNNNGDKKDNSNKPTGASAGLALAGLALAGVAVVATKKSK